MANRLNKVLTFLGLKEAPDYGQPVLSDAITRFTGWGWNRTWHQEIDYAREFGPLDESYLVMAVINWTATQLPEAPPVVQKPGKDRALEPDWGHPCANLIRRPNPFDVWANDCGALSVSWWIDGNVYWFKSRDVTGQVQELWYLPHFMVEERWPGDGRTPEVPTSGKNKALNNYISHFQYNVPGKEPELIHADNIIHIKRGKNPANPRRGIGAFDSAIRELYGDKMMAQFAATIMKNMGIVVPLLTPKDSGTTLTPEQAMAIKEAWTQGTTGANVGKPLINSIPLDVTKFAWNPTELDLSRLRLIPQTVVAALSGIPAALLQFMVGLENGTSFAAYAQAREQGYESVIIPIQSSIAEQMTWQLLPDFEDTKGAKLVFDISGVRVLQEDRDALYRRATLALTSGGISRNQFQQSLGKPDVDTEEIYYVPSMARPMTQERIEEAAKGEEEPPPPPDTDAAALARLMDMERLFADLERQMKGFEVPK